MTTSKIRPIAVIMPLLHERKVSRYNQFILVVPKRAFILATVSRRQHIPCNLEPITPIHAFRPLLCFPGNLAPSLKMHDTADVATHIAML